MSLFTKLHTTIIQLIAPIIGYLLYHCNDLFQALAHTLRSHTLLELANRYGAWYNQYLLTNILREGGVAGEITNQELRGTVMLVTFHSYGHFSPNKMRQVLADYLGVQAIQIQVNRKGSSLYSVVFPIR